MTLAREAKSVRAKRADAAADKAGVSAVRADEGGDQGGGGQPARMKAEGGRMKHGNKLSFIRICMTVGCYDARKRHGLRW